MSRQCKIETASVEDMHGRGDGAYDLLSVTGSPEEIGRAIADSLKATDLWSARGGSVTEGGAPIFLTVHIRIDGKPLESDHADSQPGRRCAEHLPVPDEPRIIDRAG